jgi:hypothetical protein
MAVTMSDFLVVNIGGTPGTAGTGTYYVSSIGGILEAGSGIAASADPATLTAWEGDPVWFGGEPYAWNGTAYVQLTTGPHPISYQVAAAQPGNRADGSAHQEGDLWFDTANDALMAYDGGAWNGVAGAAGGNSSLTDNGDNTITHTAGDGTTFTFTKAPTHVAAPGAPATAYVGDTWFNTGNNTLHMWSTDGVTPGWVQISAASATALPFDWQSVANDPNAIPTNTRSDGSGLVDGDQAWDNVNDKLYIWDGATWNEVGGSSSSTILSSSSAYAENSDPSQSFSATTAVAPAGATKAKVWGYIHSTGAGNTAVASLRPAMTTIASSTGALVPFNVEVSVSPGDFFRVGGARGDGLVYVDFY